MVCDCSRDCPERNSDCSPRYHQRLMDCGERIANSRHRQGTMGAKSERLNRAPRRRLALAVAISADRQPLQGFEDVTPTESDGMSDLDVRQVTPSHPLLDTPGRFLQPGCQFLFGEKFIPRVRNGRGRRWCTNLCTLRRRFEWWCGKRERFHNFTDFLSRGRAEVLMSVCGARDVRH